MISFEEYADHDAMGLAQIIRTKAVSPLELLETAIARIERVNPIVNAVVTTMYDLARKQIDKGLAAGPLSGVPFLLKDLGLYHPGVPTSSGSRFLADHISNRESTLLSRYRNAGLVFVGKTNVPELGLTVTTESQLWGPCRNPWNLERTSGGSSGGSAVAVATGMVPAAHGSDGGGSIRIPAACCGLFGLKPTRARIPVGPHEGESWNGMVTDHVITRSVRDSALLLDIAAGGSPGDPYCAPPHSGSFLNAVEKDPKRLRIAVSTRPPTGAEVDPLCIAAVKDAARLCHELGHHIIETDLEIDPEMLQSATVTIINTNVHAKLTALGQQFNRAVTEENVECMTWLAYEAGRQTSAYDLLKAIESIHGLGRDLARFFESHDMLLTPVLLKPPVYLGYLNTMTPVSKDYVKRLYRFFGFTALFNATGQPAMSVPLYWTPDNLPIGLQFVGRFGDEAGLLQLASQLEKARPWQTRRPALNFLTAAKVDSKESED